MVAEVQIPKAVEIIVLIVVVVVVAEHNTEMICFSSAP